MAEGREGEVQGEEEVSEVNNSGPAFPCEEVQEMSSGSRRIIYHQGMSLRDYFAAKAMQALIPPYDERGDDIAWDAYGTAIEAYKYADAMLTQREKRK